MRSSLKINKIGMDSVLSSSSATGKIDLLGQIAARVHSQWKQNTDFATENEQQPKRQKESHDIITRHENGNDSKVETVQRNGDANDNKTEPQLQSDNELERVRQKCEELERENKELREQLVENNNNSSYSSQVTKLEAEKEKFQKAIKGLNKLIEKYEKRSKLQNDLRIKVENQLKGKQKEIEDLRMQLIEMSGFAAQQGSPFKNENLQLKNENLQLKEEISVMKAKFEKIHNQFDNKLKEKNNEVVEMMVEWMDNHELLSKTQQENGKLEREIAKLTGKFTANRTEHSSLKKLENDLEAKKIEITNLNDKISELTAKHNQKLKKVENDANQLEKCLQQMKVAIKYGNHENEEMAKKLAEMECNLKERQDQLDLLLSDCDQLRNFAQNLKKVTRFPDSVNFPVVNQLAELTVHIKDKLRLMDWYIASFNVSSSGTGTCRLLLRQHV